jgi:hypothetical protein
MNTPVPGYYTTYRQSAGSQALTLVDWFRLNQDEIELQCLSDLMQLEDLIDELPSTSSSPPFESAVLGGDTSNIDWTGTGVWSGAAFKIEYEFKQFKSERYTVPGNLWLQYWFESGQQKIGFQGSRTESYLSAQSARENITYSGRGIGSIDWKLKIGRGYHKKFALFHVFNPAASRQERRYWELNFEAYGEFGFAINGAFELNGEYSQDNELFYTGFGRRSRFSIVAKAAPTFSAAAVPLNAKVKYVTEYFDHVLQSWTDIPNNKLGGSVEFTVRGSLAGSGGGYRYSAEKNQYPTAWDTPNRTFVNWNFGRIDGGVTLELKVKFRNKVVGAVNWTPNIKKLLDGKNSNFPASGFGSAIGPE